MRRLLSFALVLAMCWSMVYALIPVSEASAVETGTAALDGERYTVDWVIPDIGTADMTMGAATSTVPNLLGDLSYEILGYVSPKYPDSHATDKVYNDAGELTSGGFELLDGTVGSNHFLNDPWVGMYGDELNGILIKLDTYYTNLNLISLNMLSDPEHGIFLPSKITVATSTDGTNYNLIGVVDANENSENELNATMINTISGLSSGYYVPTEYASVTYGMSISSNDLYKGQYVLLVFEHDKGTDGFVRNWTFLSEIAVATSGTAVMEDYSGNELMATYDKPTSEGVYQINAALNSTYQIVGSLGTGRFGDNDRIQLTDGILSEETIDTSSDYVAITPTNGAFAVQVDLGTQTTNITSFTVSGYSGSTDGYDAPGEIQLYGSDDGEYFYKVSLSAMSVESDGSTYTVSYTLSDSTQAFTARFLYFVFTADVHVAFDELMVYTTNESATKENVALGGTYKYLLNTASTSFNDDVWTGTKNGTVPALDTYAKGDLNNGISATGTFLDPAWVGYNYTSASGAYVDIVFDLGSVVSGINNVNFKLLEYTNSSSTTACSVPGSFTVFYSNSDSSFSQTSSVTGAVAENGKLVINSDANNRQIYYTYSATLNNISAQYIMVRIPKDKKELLIDEINIMTGNIDPDPEVKEEHTAINYDIISGVWLDCFTITDLYLVQGTYQADEQTYRNRVYNYLTAMVEGGINTVMIHARSHGDALYGDYTFDSISPTSKRYTGSNYAVSTYDAFEIFIEEAHKVGISVHAWINPLRIGYASDLATYSSDYAVKQIYNGTYQGVSHSDYTGMSSDNLNWLNIGYESIRYHIIDTVMEIVNNYDIDAIVMDDYFYPAGATDSFDSECYTESGTTMDLGDWRRENTNMLVRGLYKRIKTAKSDVLFGISPSGRIENYETDYNYATMYADVKKWCEETWSDGTTTYKYMDYISPQLYWAPESQFASVSKYNWQSWDYRYVIDGYLGEWCSYDYDSTADNVDGVAVKLVVSLGLYRNFEDSIAVEYYNDNVVLEQLQLMHTYLLEGVRTYNPVDSTGTGISPVYGQILYRSHNLYDDFSVDVTEDSSGWATSDALTAERNAAIRAELLEYWQGELTPKS